MGLGGSFCSSSFRSSDSADSDSFESSLLASTGLDNGDVRRSFNYKSRSKTRKLPVADA